MKAFAKRRIDPAPGQLDLIHIGEKLATLDRLNLPKRYRPEGKTWSVSAAALKAVLRELQGFARDKSFCFPKVATVASNTELSEATVRRAVLCLVEIGFLSVERQRSGLRQGPNVYRLCWPNLRANRDGEQLEPLLPPPVPDCHGDESDCHHARSDCHGDSLSMNRVLKRPLNRTDGADGREISLRQLGKIEWDEIKSFSGAWEFYLRLVGIGFRGAGTEFGLREFFALMASIGRGRKLPDERLRIRNPKGVLLSRLDSGVASWMNPTDIVDDDWQSADTAIERLSEMESVGSGRRDRGPNVLPVGVDGPAPPAGNLQQ